MLRVLTTFALVGGLLPRTEGIVASPDSPCSADCGNVLSSTAEDDIQCNQGSYGTNNAAQLFQGCIDCELQSGFTSQDSSDAASALCMSRLHRKAFSSLSVVVLMFGNRQPPICNILLPFWAPKK